MLYPILKDDWQYNSSYCETHAIASINGTKAVFSPHYSPTETPYSLLWIEIKCFMFSVFACLLSIIDNC